MEENFAYGKPEKLDFKSIVLKHYQTITQLRLSKIKGDAQTLRDGIDCLSDMLRPFYDEDMNEAFKEFNQDLKNFNKEYNDNLEEFKNMDYHKRGLIEEKKSISVKLCYRKLFIALTLLLKRSDYLKIGKYGKDEDDEEEEGEE